jgi:hypothetical protein
MPALWAVNRLSRKELWTVAYPTTEYSFASS